MIVYKPFAAFLWLYLMALASGRSSFVDVCLDQRAFSRSCTILLSKVNTKMTATTKIVASNLSDLSLSFPIIYVVAADLWFLIDYSIYVPLALIG